MEKLKPSICHEEFDVENVRTICGWFENIVVSQLDKCNCHNCIYELLEALSVFSATMVASFLDDEGAEAFIDQINAHREGLKKDITEVVH